MNHAAFPSVFSCSAAATILFFAANSASAAWNMKHREGTGESPKGCYVESSRVTMSDGYQNIPILIRVDEKDVRLVTASPLDASFSDIGIQVDKNALIKVKKVLDRKEARFDAAHKELLQQFKRGTKVTARLRFWPTWPTTRIQKASFSLIGFTKAYDAMEACTQ